MKNKELYNRLTEKLQKLQEENEPTNPALWSRAKAAAKRKYDVYPSAYANAFASKWYKEKGGGWRAKSESVNEEQINELSADTYKNTVKAALQRGDSKGNSIAVKALQSFGKEIAKELAGKSFEVKGSMNDVTKALYKGSSYSYINQVKMTFTGEGSLIHDNNVRVFGSDEAHFYMKVQFQLPDNIGGFASDVKFRGYQNNKFPATIQFSIKGGKVWVWFKAADTDLEFTRAGAREMAKLADTIVTAMDFPTKAKHNTIKQFDAMKPTNESVNEAKPQFIKVKDTHQSLANGAMKHMDSFVKKMQKSIERGNKFEISTIVKMRNILNAIENQYGIKESTPDQVIKDLDKAKNDLLKKVDALIAKKKKLYSDVDIEAPMSANEKKLDKDIADLFSQINKLVLQKRSVKKESVNEKFDNTHLGLLKYAYKDIDKINPADPMYKRVVVMLDKLSKQELKQIADADIKFLSLLAKNRLSKKESVNESHFQVGDKVKMSHGGVGIVKSLDKADGADDEKYYNIELPNGDVMKHAPNELTLAETNLEEGLFQNLIKGVKKGNGPFTLVVIKNNKVVKQVNVNTPQAIPANYTSLQKDYPNSRIRIEDSTGKIVFGEASDAEEKDFHMKLDKLVHSTFGKSPDEKKNESIVNESSVEIGDFVFLKSANKIATVIDRMGRSVTVRTADGKKIKTIINNIKTLAQDNVNEGNAFTGALFKARKEGLTEFEFNGKMYPVHKLEEEEETPIKESKLSKNDLKKIIKEEYHNVKNFMEEQYGFVPEFGKVYSNLAAKPFLKEEEEEVIEEYDVENYQDLKEFVQFMAEYKADINEAEYQGRKVKLGKIMQGDVKKFKVYVRNDKGNVVKVNFGQGGDAKGGTMRIRKDNPKARASFRARHNCDNPGPRWKARYWSCKKW